MKFGLPKARRKRCSQSTASDIAEVDGDAEAKHLLRDVLQA
jgi:hypothetical protein